MSTGLGADSRGRLKYGFKWEGREWLTCILILAVLPVQISTMNYIHDGFNMAFFSRSSGHTHRKMCLQNRFSDHRKRKTWRGNQLNCATNCFRTIILCHLKTM